MTAQLFPVVFNTAVTNKVRQYTLNKTLESDFREKSRSCVFLVLLGCTNECTRLGQILG
jgi:hypothetical protein